MFPLVVLTLLNYVVESQTDTIMRGWLVLNYMVESQIDTIMRGWLVLGDAGGPRNWPHGRQ